VASVQSLQGASKPVPNGAFTATVSAITSAFGDPTRRAVYLFVRDSDDGVTAAQVADRFALHPNVARHHLDKLAAGGYVEVSVERAGKTGAGRPSKRYRIAADTAELAFPVRSDDLVLSLLGRALDLLPREQAEAMAEDIGRQYGQALPVTARCARRSRRSPMHSPPTASPPTPNSGTTNCASSTTTVRSATSRSNTPSSVRSIAEW
jgi:DNA-binding transcriptional ArsR family regulator